MAKSSSPNMLQKVSVGIRLGKKKLMRGVPQICPIGGGLH